MNKQQGFSLVELAAVMVIIGLLVAGVTAGVHLTRSATIVRLSKQVDEIKTAISTFKTKYDAYPGDMVNAANYWSTTVNGDGDGQIEYDTSGGANSIESLRMWQQLNLAGMYPGNFTGIGAGGGSVSAVIGTNVPASPVDGGGYYVNYQATGAWGTYPTATAGFYITVGGYVAGNGCYAQILPVNEAYALDKKLDDGVPTTGTVLGGFGTGATDCTSTTASNAAYNASTSGVKCSVGFYTEDF